MRRMIIVALLCALSYAQTASSPSSGTNVYRPPPGCFRMPIGGDCGGIPTQRCCVSPPHQLPGSKVCMWDADERECIESMPGDPEHVCAQFSAPGRCRQSPMCFWDLAEYKCVQFSDANLNFPVFPPQGGYSGNPSNRAPSGNSNNGAPPARPGNSYFYPPRPAPINPFYPQSNPFMPNFGGFTNADSGFGSSGVGGDYGLNTGVVDSGADTVVDSGSADSGVVSTGSDTGTASFEALDTNQDGVIDRSEFANTDVAASGSESSTDANSEPSATVDSGVDSSSSGAELEPAAPIEPATPVEPEPQPVDTGSNSSPAPRQPSQIPPPMQRDCEMFLSPNMCKGQFHERKVCLWDYESRECIESVPGDPEHVCASLGAPSECNSNMACRWQMYRCVQLSDFTPVFPAFMPPMFPPRPVRPSPSNERPTYTPPRPAYTPPSSNNAPTFTPPSSANRGPFFTPPSPPARPTYTPPSSNNAPAFTPPSSASRGPSFPHLLPNWDCEHYLSPTQCNGKMHDGRQCSWSVSQYECTDIEIGDAEHICDSFATRKTCTEHSRMCGYDVAERRCVQLSDLDPLPIFPWQNMNMFGPGKQNMNMFGPGKFRGRLKSAHCALHLQQSECKNDQNCNWDFANTRCHTLKTQSANSADLSESYNYNAETLPSRPSALLLFLMSFVYTLVGIGAYHLIVAARERWHRKKEAPEDFYYQVDGVANDIDLDSLRS